MSHAPKDGESEAAPPSKLRHFVSKKRAALSLTRFRAQRRHGGAAHVSPVATAGATTTKRKDGYFAGALGATVVAIVGVFAASCVSIYSTDIVRQGGTVITAVWGDISLPDNWQLKLTGLLIVAAMIVVFLRERALGAVVTSRAKEFEDRISTLPPQSFLDVYGTAIKEVGDVRRNTKILYREGKLSKEALEHSVRSVLKVVLGLAKLWDGVASEKDTMVYRANIMIVIHPDSMAGLKEPGNPFETLINESPFFLYRDNLASRIDYSTGLLIIENSAFTASSLVAASEPDDMVKPLCLPFSTQAVNAQPNLPGAPEGVVNRSASYVGNTTKEMKHWLDGLATAEPRYHNEYARGIRNYYENRREAQSILSMPIEFEGEVIAMLNIYRNKDNIFKGQERGRQFVSLMLPICYQLSKMLKLASELE
ncbi:GAF domain-containing protein [Pseudomonas amygdali]|uniref:GAF domain-containing protein n=1 Tax=Pseudomonas amygdali TaxID=47877 RepID=UPI000E3E2EA9|nr:GAF domain-containing protein [Pseudomonas amygdali]